MPERQYKHVPAPTLGLVKNLPPGMIPERAMGDGKNVTFREGEVRQVRGSIEGFATLSGDVFFIDTLEDTLLVHTSTHFYSSADGLVFTDRTDSSFTGTLDDFYSSLIFATDYIFSNGKDEIRTWDFAAADCSSLANATTYKPAWINSLGQRLCLYGGSTGGTANPRRVRNSVVGDATDWTGVGAGYTDIDNALDPYGEIVRAERLADGIVIYANNSICVQQYMGELTNPFHYYSAVPNKGLAASHALISLNGKEHIFLGNENIYSYTGGRELVPIADSIKDYLFRRINPEYLERVFMVYLKESNKLRLHYATIGSSSPNAYFEYDLGDKTWTEGTKSVLCSGRYTLLESLTWADLLGTWADWEGIWKDASITKGFESTIYGGASGVLYWNEGSIDEAGSVIESEWESKDFSPEGQYQRIPSTFYEIVFEAKGNSVLVEYSTDQGISWTSIGTSTLESAWAKYHVNFPAFRANQVRFRFSNSTISETFSLRWLAFGFIPGESNDET